MATMDIIARLKLAGESFSADYERAIGGLEGRAKRASETVGTAFSSAAKVATGALASIGIAGLAREYLALADRAKQMDAQLKLATASFGSLGQAQSDVARIAAVTRNGLSETTSLYGAFVRSSEALGKSQGEAARATETFSKALKLGGADAAAASSATLQFSQALASGVLRGDEFNSIAEASPRILKLIADSAGVSAGALRAMAADGKLSAEVLYKALTDRQFTAGIDAEFRTLPVTFDEAVQKVSNAATLTFGAFDRGGEFSKALADFVSGGGDGFEGLAENAEQFGISVRGTLAGLGAVFDPMVQAGEAAFTALGIKLDVLLGDGRKQIADLIGAADSVLNIGPSIANRFGAGGRYDSRMQERFLAGAKASDDRLKAEARDRAINANFALQRGGLFLPVTKVPTTGGDGGGDTSRKLRATKAAAKEASDEIKKIVIDFSQVDAFADKATEGAQRFYKALGDAPGIGDVIRQQDEAADRAYEQQRDRNAEAVRENDRMAEEQSRQQQENIRGLAGLYRSAFDSGSGSIWQRFKEQGEDVIAELAARYTLALLSGKSTDLGSILGAAQGSGSPLGGLIGGLGSLFGGGSSSGGGATTGGINNIARTLGFGGSAATGGAAAAGGLLGGAGAALSAAAPYLALASVALPVIGGLFKGSKSGVATITNANGAGALAGTSGKSRTAASGLAGTVQDNLKQIADSLGATLGSFAVSIGIRNGDYRVDPTGRGNLKVKKGVVDFGDDQEAAVKYAVADALKDGVLTGVSAATQRLLTSGGDIDQQLAKAVQLESIPRLLKARTDPVGAAIDALNEKFAGLVKIMDEAGASVEDRADAETLYRLELEDAKKASGGAADALKDFLAGMSVGAASPFSLRDQEAAAKAVLDPLLAKINAGVSVDQEKYLAAAQDYLAVERQLNGSTQAFFDAQSAIQAATNKLIATTENATPISTSTTDPFVKATATAAEKTAGSTQATAEILADQTALLTQIRDGLTALGNTGGTSFASGLVARAFI